MDKIDDKDTCNNILENLKKSLLEVAESTLDICRNTRKRAMNTFLERLAKTKHDLKLQILQVKDKNIVRKLKKERKVIQKEAKKNVYKVEENEINCLADKIGAIKDDSNRYFGIIKQF